MPTIDITGQRYGRLVAVKRIGKPSSHTRWLFKCDCGTKKKILLGTVRCGQTVSCGCFRRQVSRDKAIDITGERYGRLTAIHRIVSDPRLWLFRCNCGKKKIIFMSNVRRGTTKSCGCLLIEKNKALFTTHGNARKHKITRTYRAWQGAKNRCFNPDTPKFYLYGGRGITMIKRWANNFNEFLKDMGDAPDGRTLERKNVNGKYSKRNCCWATLSEQARNRRSACRIDKFTTNELLDELKRRRVKNRHNR